MAENKIASKADEDRDRGLENLKTCAILFKCSPNYEEAIPYLKSAANGYKSLRNLKEEMFCRLQLIECFRKTDSLWEEGNEYERVSQIQIFELKDNVSGQKNIINAHRAFYEKGDYQEANNCIYKTVVNLRQDSANLDSSEKLLKVSFESLLKYSHVLLSKDEQSDFIYKTFKLFIATLVQNNKTRNAIESCDLMIKAIKNFESNKSNLFDVYLTKIVCMIINESLESELAQVYCECEAFIEDREDFKKLKAAKDIKEAIDFNIERKFNENIYLVGVSLDNELVKKLRKCLNGRQNDLTNPNLKDPESFL